ncbi:MAG: tRNA preQ1(34) S-adenosylmethionine ribosyltransferase-isomerase QueA [Dehalococcoidales bacterium]|nr:tRNA preQ1(34) S-adenosylmethionine ribosyltransferase-isomerase QueA [Dehalococcoidales bacterium]MDP6043067.1 tRNA preQ1(34) S-adenosylmethionine ribosyltransferase-isomerase QueA [Dehalococcoidales bacterium]MDP6448559.1 tRNA preQ1(34) S-adenosylmethionine ribosyltransferase-isomerase QueA [Dehalococcoidales bacterium]MDP6576616.1 tRNA preQ1(34) S-adenosylmethionine ribosyltransferase-isomerase QueA [Dehalococcoidales bacterium]MDP7285649.1 tRNA preQ1(34) S-adenosylmethionine ribosyltrans
MKTSNFDYSLPPELIAQTPVEPRDQSRLMVLDRGDGTITHRRFFELIDYLRDGDVLVFNDSRVIPARLDGRKADGGGRVEILLLRRLETNVWEALGRPARQLRAGAKVILTSDSVEDNRPEVTGEVIQTGRGGLKTVRFSEERRLAELGQIPLPPYIHAPLTHPERYQTVYARVAGSVAATTAGLHFTPELIKRIAQKGVRCLFVTLHIGLDTFSPVREDDPQEHPIHSEYGVMSPTTADRLSQAKREGRRIICVGTTTVRIVEQVTRMSRPLQLQPFEDWVNLFILPGYQFRLVDALITNFHLPRSTLLMLVTAFAGKEHISQAYQEAIASGYRFYSFGDAMLVL